MDGQTRTTRNGDGSLTAVIFPDAVAYLTSSPETTWRRGATLPHKPNRCRCRPYKLAGDDLEAWCDRHKPKRCCCRPHKLAGDEQSTRQSRHGLRLFDEASTTTIASSSTHLTSIGTLNEASSPAMMTRPAASSSQIKITNRWLSLHIQSQPPPEFFPFAYVVVAFENHVNLDIEASIT